MLKRILSLVLAIIGVALVPMSYMGAFADNTVDSYKNQIEELQEEEAKYQAILEKTQDKIETKKAYSDSLVAQIDVLNQQISVSQKQISALSSRISQKQGEIQEAENRIDAQVDTLKKRIRVIYMAGNTSDLEIILGAKNFSDFIDKKNLVEALSAYDQKLIDGIQKDIEVIVDEKAALEVDRADLQESQDVLDEKQSKLQSLLDENEAVLASLYDDEADAQAMIENAQAQEDEIQSKLNAYYASQQSSQNQGGQYINPSPSGFAWPVPGFYYVISSFDEDRGYSHKGVDITGGIMGATTVAADNGIVVASNNSCSHNWGKSGSCGCGGGYGNYVLIDHGNGKTTMYAHLSSAVVSSGQSVSKGQTIGYVGSTGWSTGAHLHYECRYNGVVYDPMSEY